VVPNSIQQNDPGGCDSMYDMGGDYTQGEAMVNPVVGFSEEMSKK
jgi:hypothetical protein